MGQDTGLGARKPEFESCGRRQMCNPVTSVFSGVNGAGRTILDTVLKGHHKFENTEL